MEAQIFKLGDLFKITSGGTPRRETDSYFGGNIPWIKTGDLKVRHLSNASEFITKEGLENSSAKIFPKNTVLIAMYGATIGACSILKIDAATNQACAALLPNKKVNPEFLYFYLLSIKPKLIDKGVGGGQPNISGQILKETEIVLPELKKQNEIVKIIEQADTARQKRKQANQLTEQFLQSAFLEMFGDPLRNEEEWEVKTLEEVCNKIADGTHFSPPNLEQGEYKYVTAKNIKKHGFDFSNLTYIDEEHHKEIYRRCNPEYGDVLYIKDGVTTGIAMVNTLHEEFSMLSSVALFKPNKKINSVFLSHYLNNDSVYLSIRNSMGGAAITRLTVEKLKRIRVVLPPLTEQKKFASLVAKTEKLRSKQRESERELENLFQSLMQKYFG